MLDVRTKLSQSAQQGVKLRRSLGRGSVSPSQLGEPLPKKIFEIFNVKF